MNLTYRSWCSALWRGLVLLALSAVLVTGCVNSRRAQLSPRPPTTPGTPIELAPGRCENTTSGLARVSVIEEPYALALELARTMPEAFLTEVSQPNAWFEAMPASTQVAIRAVLAELYRQWADDLRSSVAASEPIARVRDYQQALLRRVVNTYRTGEQPPWGAHSSEIFPGYTEYARPNTEWMAFGRVIRGSTNCVGHMLLLGELARDDVSSNNAVNYSGHWMNEFELPRIGPFGVDNWTQVPPFSFTGDVERGILSLAEVNDLLEERSGGPSTEELFDPAIRHSALPICNTDDWQYAVRSPISAVDLPLVEVPVELAGEERLAVVRFLVARIHHVYGAHEEALVAYEELATLSCVRDEDERITPNLLPFCRSAALHASRLLGPAD